MMKISILFIFAVILTVSANVLNDDYSTFCYQVMCPSQTTSCKKEVVTLKDIRRLRTTVTCLDRLGHVLETNISDDEHYQEGLQIKSISFTGTMPRDSRYRSNMFY